MRFQRTLTDNAVVDILESKVSDAKAGKKYGISRQSVQQIRRGNTYANVRPEIPRRSNQSCRKCEHWRKDCCSFGFPDPIEEGPQAARDCSLYAVISS